METKPNKQSDAVSFEPEIFGWSLYIPWIFFKNPLTNHFRCGIILFVETSNTLIWVWRSW